MPKANINRWSYWKDLKELVIIIDFENAPTFWWYKHIDLYLYCSYRQTFQIGENLNWILRRKLKIVLKIEGNWKDAFSKKIFLKTWGKIQVSTCKLPVKLFHDLNVQVIQADSLSLSPMVNILNIFGHIIRRDNFKRLWFKVETDVAVYQLAGLINHFRTTMLSKS